MLQCYIAKLDLWKYCTSYQNSSSPGPSPPCLIHRCRTRGAEQCHYNMYRLARSDLVPGSLPVHHGGDGAQVAAEEDAVEAAALLYSRSDESYS